MSTRRFELKRELGTGTFGTVFLADMVSSGGFRRSVALKLLNKEWDGGSDAGRRLRDEARLLGRLRHRNIVAVDDLIQLDGRWAVVMEHIPGADLERILMALHKAGQQAPLLATLEITGAVAAALDAARNSRTDDGQALDVVHRDIKPSNIRVTEDGDVKVLDFGIARASFEGREARTERVRYGSVGYMAPERLLGEPETTAGDVFAVAVVALELLLVRPFGRIELAPDKAEAQVAAALADLRAQRPEVPEALCQLLQDMLAYDPEPRPGPQAVADTCRRLARTAEGADLATWARALLPQLDTLMGDASAPVERLLTEDVQPIDTRANPTLVVSSAEGTAPRPAANRGVLLAAGLAVFAIVVILASIALLRPADPPPAAPLAPKAPAAATTAPAEVAPAAPAVEVPVEAPVAQPVAPKAEPPRGTKTAPKPIVPAEAPAPPEAGKTLRGVKFTVEGASAVEARCGGVRGAGTTSVYLRDVPAGSCTVTATVDGATAAFTTTVNEPGGLTCALSGGALACH